MTLGWIKCTDDNWCSFSRVNLAHSHFMNLEGVYIIWHSGSAPATVYVGQGNIAARLQAHRSNDRILVYSHLGLFVTWARVDTAYRDGVERFLIDRLRPKETLASPNVTPVVANFPWA